MSSVEPRSDVGTITCSTNQPTWSADSPTPNELTTMTRLAPFAFIAATGRGAAGPRGEGGTV